MIATISVGVEINTDIVFVSRDDDILEDFQCTRVITDIVLSAQISNIL